MAQDPEAGISILLDRPIDTYSREIRTNDYDTSAWLDLIDKHKQYVPVSLSKCHSHAVLGIYTTNFSFGSSTLSSLPHYINSQCDTTSLLDYGKLLSI